MICVDDILNVPISENIFALRRVKEYFTWLLLEILITSLTIISVYVIVNLSNQ